MTHLLASILALTVTCIDDPAPVRRGEEVEIHAQQAAAAPAAAFPEGAFLSERAGTLYKSTSGNLLFVADEAASESIPGVQGPIAFLPNEALGTLETLCAISTGEPGPAQATSTAPADAKQQLEAVKRMKVSGQLFRFHQQPYLLLTVVPVEISANAAADAGATKPASNGQAGQAAAPKTAQDLIAELESRRTTPRGMEAAATSVAPPDARTPTKEAAGERVKIAKRREGDQLTSRQGRIVRHGSWLVFTPDSGMGAEGKQESDPPIVLLACKQLERLEFLAKEVGDSARYSVSGRVTAYRGRNYLLPLLVQVMPPSDLSPRQ